MFLYDSGVWPTLEHNNSHSMAECNWNPVSAFPSHFGGSCQNKVYWKLYKKVSHYNYDHYDVML